VLEVLRDAWASPIGVTCWYRTPAYNQALINAAIAAGRQPGAAKNSQHMTASAADIHPIHLSDIPRMRKLIQDMIAAGRLPALGGWGVYPQWLHVDVRPKPPSGHVAFWLGAGVADERA
jgi:uncharacterized protein YcbK (DUF882 family)